jgi:hypothetical protein
MKQINSLIVLEVPKDSRNYSMDRNILLYDIPNRVGRYVALPPGQYEIIGLYSENPMTDRMGVTAKLTALKAADRRSATYDVAWRFRELQDEYQLQPTDTTDLLFIKKLK